MNNSKIALNGLLHAAGTVVYIALISLLLYYGGRIFGNNSILSIISILSLLVLSATIIGALMLGRPVMWFLNGAKKEAIKLFSFSLIWLLLFTVIFLLVMAVLKSSPTIY